MNDAAAFLIIGAMVGGAVGFSFGEQQTWKEVRQRVSEAEQTCHHRMHARAEADEVAPAMAKEEWSDEDLEAWAETFLQANIDAYKDVEREAKENPDKFLDHELDCQHRYSDRLL